jgi:hypothetical protein
MPIMLFLAGSLLPFLRDGVNGVDGMLQPFAVDRLVGGMCCLGIVPLLANRWQYYAVGEVAFFLVPFLCGFSLFALPKFKPTSRFYSQNRAFFILAIKAVSCVIPIARVGVRLQQPPTGSWLDDWSRMFIGGWASTRTLLDSIEK